jgi:UDP:flavonoid glycosyltransferase YjiC (YdhE family)
MLGQNQDPADFGPQRGNVQVERYIPLSLVLSYCDLVVTNGGSGTLTAALGLGRVVAVEGLTPATASRAVRAVLAQQAYRAAAGQMRAEINALPDADHAVALLERLGTERQPILAG